MRKSINIALSLVVGGGTKSVSRNLVYEKEVKSNSNIDSKLKSQLC